MKHNRPKVILYKPALRIIGNRYDFLFKDKVTVLEHYFNLEIVEHTAENKLSDICNGSHAAIFLYVNLNLNSEMYAYDTLKFLRKLKTPKIAIYNTDPFASSRYAGIELIKYLKCCAILASDPSVSGYLKLPTIPMFYWPWSVGMARTSKIKKKHDLLASSRQKISDGYYMFRMKEGPRIEALFSDIIKPSDYSWDKFQDAISLSKFAYTCGSCSNTLVMKHLEIPSNRTCLITEETPIIRAAGFEDMVNCITGSGKELISKIQAVKDDSKLYQTITDNGMNLVQEKHHYRSRTQASDLVRHIMNGEDLNNLSQKCPFSPITTDKNDLLSHPWISQMPPRELAYMKEFENRAPPNYDIKSIDAVGNYVRKYHPEFYLMKYRMCMKKNLFKDAHNAVAYFFKTALYSDNIVILDTGLIETVFKNNKIGLVIEKHLRGIHFIDISISSKIKLWLFRKFFTMPNGVALTFYKLTNWFKGKN